MAPLTYRPELDGLRAVAVYLVVAFYAELLLFDGGFVGVDVFFVLSGFLVTGVLLRDVDETGRVQLQTFYARRVRRLLPAALLVILVTAALQLLISSLPARLELVDDARASLLYYANWHFIYESGDYFAAATAEESPFLHFWSLAIEEQFYVVYPLILWLVVRSARSGGNTERTLGLVLVAIIVGSVAAQLYFAQTDPGFAYYATPTRVYQLAVGAALMLLVRRFTRVSSYTGNLFAFHGLAGTLIIASSLISYDESVRGLLVTLFAGAAVVGLWWSSRGAVSKLLALPVPRYLGQISYGTYLWHWPIILFFKRVFDIPAGVLAVLAIVVATGMAALSYQVLERPIRTTDRLKPFAGPVVGLGLTASIVLALTAAPGILQTDRKPALAGGERQETVQDVAALLNQPVPDDLDLVGASRDTDQPNGYCTPDDLLSCRLVEGEGTSILLVGDSQARMIQPAIAAIAEANDLSLYTSIVFGCPWQTEQTNPRLPDEEAVACDSQRNEFYTDVLPRLDVDVVMVLGLSRSDAFWEGELTSPTSPAAGESLDQLQQRTTRRTAGLVQAADKELLIIQSVIGTGGFGREGFDPLECLANADRLADCAVYPPIERPAVDSAYEALAVNGDDIATMDLNPVICPDLPVCAPVVSETVVWKDRTHVTATFFVERQDEIWGRMRASGFFD